MEHMQSQMSNAEIQANRSLQLIEILEVRMQRGTKTQTQEVVRAHIRTLQRRIATLREIVLAQMEESRQLALQHDSLYCGLSLKRILAALRALQGALLLKTDTLLPEVRRDF